MNESTDVRAARVARNEHVWREANSAIEAAVSNFAGESAHDRFLCECARRDCVTMIDIDLAEVRRAREDATTFIVAPEHVAPEHERVRERHDTWWLVQKIGMAAVVAESLDHDAHG